LGSSSRATDRPTESLNSVAAISTEDIIANPAAPPPGPSPPPGGGAVRIRDIQFPATSAAHKTAPRVSSILMSVAVRRRAVAATCPTATRRRDDADCPASYASFVARGVASGKARDEFTHQRTLHDSRGLSLSIASGDKRWRRTAGKTRFGPATPHNLF
ncbi:hypothetical protein THAOC_10203, partial [Thalassiosira oceanica]